MPTIEQRVVEMRFDNKQFEDNANQSINTLDKLNKSLEFDKASGGLKKITDAAKNFTLSSMEAALTSVTEKFSVLEIAGITAIQNLTNKAVNMATNFVKSNTIDQVTAGWQKYADKTSAVQTIMSATAKDIADEGKRMEFVNEQIEKLNWFTDETSYSLLDMTNNIGKFTSNGVKLDSAVTQMEGISVWASLSGASLNDASRAMYNLSQAMASGQVKSIDWMSIENANMATKEFKEEAIKAAVSLGTLKKTTKGYTTAAGKAVDVTGNFRETLSTGWFSGKVLEKTLKKFGSFTDKLNEFQDAYKFDNASQAIKVIDDYAAGTYNVDKEAKKLGVDAQELKKRLDELSSSEMELGRRSFKAAQEAKTFQEAVDATKEAVASGWMNTFELLFGNYLEAKELWTNLANELYNVFASSAYDRNQILRIWHDGLEDGISGYKSLMTAFSNIWDGIKNIASIIGDAWDAVFPAADEYRDAAKPLIDFTEKFRKATESFKNYFASLEEDIEEVTQPITETAESVKKTLSVVDRTQEKLESLVKRTRNLEFGNGEERKKNLRELGYSYEVVQNEVNRQIELETGQKLIRHEIREQDLKSYYDEETKSVKKLSEATGTASDELEGFSSEQGEVKEYLSEAERRTQILRSLFVGIFETVELGKTIFEGIGKVISHTIGVILQKLEGPFWDALDNITDKVEYFYEVFAPVDHVTEFFDNMIPVIDKAADMIEEFFKKLGENESIIHLKTALEDLGNMFTEIIGKIFEKLKERNDSIDWAYTFQKALDLLGDALAFVAEMVAKGIDYITSYKGDIEKFLGMFNNAIPKNLDEIGEGFGKLGETLKNFGGGSLNKIGGVLGAFFALINKQITDPHSTLHSAIDKAKELFGKLTDTLASLDTNKAGKMLKNGGLIGIGVMIFNFFNSINKGVKNIADIPKKIGNILDGVKGVLKGYQNELNSKALLNVAKAIGIFTLSMIGMSLLSPEDLRRVSASLILLLGMVALVLKVLKGSSAETDLAETIMEPINKFLKGIQKAFEKFVKFAGMAVLIAAVAAGIFVLVKCLNNLMEIPWQKLIIAGTALLAIAGILVGSAVLLSKFANNLNEEVGVSILAMAASMWVMAKAMTALSLIDAGKFQQAMMGLGLLVAGIAALAVTSNGADLTKLGLGMIAIAVAINMLLVPIGALALAGTNALIGLASIIALVGALGAIGVWMANNEGAGNELLKMAGALVALSVPLYLVGKNAEMCQAGLYVLAGALGALVLAGLGAQYVSSGLTAIALSSLAVAAAAVMFGAGAYLIASAIDIVVGVLPKIVDGLIALGTGIQEHGTQMLIGFVAILTAIGIAIIAASPTLAAAVVSLLTTVAAAIVAQLPTFATSAFALILGILAFVYATIPEVINSLLDIIVETIHALADGIRTHAAPIFQAIGDLLDACFDLIVEAVASVADMIPGVGKMLGNTIRGAKDWVTPSAEDFSSNLEENLTDVSVDGMGDQLSSDIGNEIESMDITEPTEKKANSLVSTLTDSFKGFLGEHNLSVEDLMAMYGNSEEAADQSATQDAETYQTSFKDKMYDFDLGEWVPIDGLSTQMSEGGVAGADAYSNSMISQFGFNQSSMVESVKSYIGQMSTDTEDSHTDAGKAGADAQTEGFVGELSVNTEKMEDAVEVSADSASDAGEVVLSDGGVEGAHQYNNGLYSGSLKYEYIAENAGRVSGRAMNRGYKAETLTKSPSRVAMQMGKFWDMGLAKGTVDNLSIVSNGAKKAGNAMIDTMRSIVDQIGSVIDDEDLNPTITPVLDLSNIQNGTNSLNSLFGSRTLSLAAANGAQFDANRLAALNALEMNSKNSDVVAALGLLRGDVNALNDSFANTQVVLDSGALVGATAQQMDNALGRFKVYKGRGI